VTGNRTLSLHIWDLKNFDFEVGFALEESEETEELLTRVMEWAEAEMLFLKNNVVVLHRAESAVAGFILQNTVSSAYSFREIYSICVSPLLLYYIEVFVWSQESGERERGV